MSRRSTSTGEPISLITLARKIAEEMHTYMVRHPVASADQASINMPSAGAYDRGSQTFDA